MKRCTVFLVFAALAATCCPFDAAADVVINEFMAKNNSALEDPDDPGEYPDWIEIYNDSTSIVDLDGWYLTDDAGDLTRWRLPATNLGAHAFLVVFASGKDLRDPGEQLHTSFKLTTDGEYLALVRPDGVSVASEYNPGYPGQTPDVSFGLRPDTTNMVLVGEDSACALLVPTNGSLGQSWTQAGFNDSGWISGPQGVGYEVSPTGYLALIQTSVPEETTGAYVRLSFALAAPGIVDALVLSVKYDDGFAAYLNGTKVSQANVLGTPAWDSPATLERPNSRAVESVEFNLSDYTSLLTAGENVLAVHALNFDAGSPDSDFLLVAELEGFRYTPGASDEHRFFRVPTPGARNLLGAVDYLEPVAFSVERGFHAVPFSLVLSASPGSAIYYTLDGKEPTTSSLPYTGALSIARSLCVRAKAFKQDYESSRPVTHTYLFPGDIIASPDMRTSITQDPTYGPQMTNALTALPSICIATESDVINWTPELSASVEMITTNQSEGFHINAGVARFGNRVTNFAKRQFRLYFREKYGASKLKYPVFKGFDHGVPAVDEFDQLDLRSGSHDMSQRGFYMSGRFCDDTLLETGNLNTHGRFVHVYLNGRYWGQYHMRERWKADTLAEYLGGDKADYEAVEGDGSSSNWFIARPVDGDGSAWTRVKALANDYHSVKNYLNVPQFLDFMWMWMYGNSEYEFRAAGATNAGVNGYMMQLRDPDGYLRSGSKSVSNRGPGSVLQMLRSENHPDFRALQSDRIFRMFFHDGVMTPTRNRDRLLERCREIEAAFLAESARWGYRTPASWATERDRALDRFLTKTDNLLNAFRSAGYYPVEAPEYNRRGGVFTNTFLLSITGSGDIYYTLDGTDPREQGTGQAAGTHYDGPLTLSNSAVVKARVMNSPNEWSAVHEVLFLKDVPSPLRITEVMANPRKPADPETHGYGRSDYEFVELQNTGSNSIGLAGLRLDDGVDFDFTYGAVATLAPGEYCVVVDDLGAFTNRYENWASMNIAGQWDGDLDDGGERLRLVDGFGRTNSVLRYGDGRGWPLAADGAGHSLVPLQVNDQTNGVLDYGGSWRASTYMDGSPGRANPVAMTDVVINEVGAHTDTGLAPPLDSDDWVELFNRTGSAIPLDNWYLSDDAGDLTKWRIPATNVIRAANWMTFTERNGFNPDGANGFGLNKAGEQVFLSHLPGGASDRVADCTRFKGQANGVSLGRYPDGETYWCALNPTPNAANGSPARQVVISEIMYHPLPTLANPEDNANDEYIEILNVSGSRVDLWNAAGTWRIDGKDFTFPPGTSLDADESLVVVSFDPANAIAMDTFLGVYGLANGEVQIFGPYSGRLSNRGERIALERPQAPDIVGGSVSWVIVDEVIYFDRGPWPAQADGTGRALDRTQVQAAGNNPANWQVGFRASPGVPPPTLSISSPEYGETLLLGSSASAMATIDASRVVGSVDHVEFFLDGDSICVSTSEPYQCTFGPITNAGSHIISAIMADSAGSYTSREVVVIGTGVDSGPGTSNLTFSAAELGGSLWSNAQAAVHIYWGPDDGLTDKGAWSNTVNLGMQRGRFAAPVDGLRSCETYFYRCYATNAYGDTWAVQTTNLTTLPPPVSLSLSGSPFDEDGGSATVTATLGNVSASNATVHLAFSGDALYGADYSASATTIVIYAGGRSGSVTLTGRDDSEVESMESAVVGIHAVTHAVAGIPSSVAAPIISDDPQVENGGASSITDSSATLNGNLTHGDSASVTIYWGTSDGGAGSTDWDATNSLGPRTEGTLSADVSGLLANQTYYYRCYAENAGGADWADSTASFRTEIPSLSVLDVTLAEGDSGARNAEFTVVPSSVSGTDLSVNYATANGTAESGTDYQAASGRLSIDAGQPSGLVSVLVNGDIENEWPFESFHLDLDNPTNCAVADGRATATIEDDDVDVYLIDWRYRMKITLGGYGRDETLADFPALVVLNTNRENFAYSQFDRGVPNDLRFANSNLTALLYYEVEEWNTNGDSVIWARVPDLKGTNTTIWAYWGNPNASNAPAYTTNGAVWESHFRGVWHVSDEVVDSTSHGNHAAADNSVGTDGVVAGGKSFNGSDQAITLGDLDDFDMLGDMTLSAWVKPDVASSGEDCIFGKWGDSYMLSLSNRRPRFHIDGWRDADTTLTGGEWGLVTVTYDDSPGTVRFYVNGEPDGIHSYHQGAGTSGPLYLGRRGGEWFQGEMDEFRMSDVARSSNWVWACWLNMASNDMFNAYGEVESADVDAPSVFIVFGATNLTDTSAQLTARLTSTGTAATAVWMYWGAENGGQSAANWANTNYLGPVSRDPSIDFSATVTGLASNTLYHYACRAANSNGAGWASSAFTTFGPPAVKPTGGATAIVAGAAGLQGSLALGNQARVTIYWGPFDPGADKDAWAGSIPLGTIYDNGSPFSADVAGLLYGLRYHYRCYATNSYGEGWSDSANFLTLPPRDGEGGSGSTDIRVNSGSDDAEESDAGRMDLNSSDLELVYDGGDGIQHVGMCFDGVTIPTGTTITDAYIQFKVDETDSSDVTVTIRGEAIDNAATFSTADRNISSRNTTAAFAEWSPVPWNTAGAAGVDQRTPDLSAVVREVVERPGWADGNSLAIIITGTETSDKRTAESWNGDSGGAAVLHVWWTTNVPSIAITNAVATDISTTSATFNAALAGTGSVFDVHVHWGTTDGASRADEWANTSFVGAYTNVASADLSFSPGLLSCNSTYYYTFSAGNAATNMWGGRSIEFFNGLPDAPVVNNAGGATDIGVGRGTVNGMLSNGDAATAYICWQGGSDAGTSRGTGGWDHVIGIGAVNRDEPFSAGVSGLYYGLRYFYRCYVTNDHGRSWSGPTSFTTLPPSGAGGDAVTLIDEEFTGGAAPANTAHVTWSDSTGGGYETYNSGGAGVRDMNSVYDHDQDGGTGDITIPGGIELNDNAGSVTLTATVTMPAEFNAGSGVLTFFAGLRRDTGASPAVTIANTTDGTSVLSTESVAINADDNTWEHSLLGDLFSAADAGDTIEVRWYGGGSGSADGLQLCDIELTVQTGGSAGLGITNTAATNVEATSADLNAQLSATAAVFQVWAYWGEADGTNDPSAWTGRAHVGGYTNGFFAVGHSATGLVEDATYYCTFMATNAAGAMWASPSAEFKTALDPRVSLVVASEYGSPVPPVGTHAVPIGSNVALTLAGSPIVGAHTQHVCIGWTGTGDIPNSGVGTNAGFLAINTPSTIAWNWETNYWLGVVTIGPGTVTHGNAWYALGSNVILRAVNEPYYSFENWSGDVGTSSTSEAECSVLMSRGRLLTAAFTPNFATNRTPEWWLAGYYGHTNDFDALALSDTDRDGMAAWKEHKAGTSPIDGGEYLQIREAALAAGADDFVISWNTVSGRLYSVYSTTNLLSSWITNLYRSPGDGLLKTYTNAHAEGRSFFRIGVKQPVP